jgi:hypothetical protein
MVTGNTYGATALAVYPRCCVVGMGLLILLQTTVNMGAHIAHVLVFY